MNILKAINDSLLYILLITQIFNTIYQGVAFYIERTGSMFAFMVCVGGTLYLIRLNIRYYNEQRRQPHD